MNTVYLDEYDEPVNICYDNVFKAVFTRETPESRIAVCRASRINCIKIHKSEFLYLANCVRTKGPRSPIIVVFMAFSTKKVIKTCNCNRLLDTQSKVVQAKREGMQKGRQEVARNLKKLGIPVEQIAQGTGLSPDEIAAL